MQDELVTFRTAVGWCAMIGQGAVLRALAVGYRDSAAAVARFDPELTATARTSSWNRALMNRLIGSLEGEPDDFRDVDIDLSHLGPFALRVVAACRRIEWGETRTYAQLAEAARRPRAARAVGRVMSQNRTPLVVPCHRVIGSSGKLVGFSAPQGIQLKRRLLALESAAVCAG
jgi:methylated-DNA-[protein]-cysteine S-methyltransferase